MILGYIRSLYDREPALITGLAVALIAPVADLLGASIPTEKLGLYVAAVLGAALATRRKVTAPATLYPTDEVDEQKVVK